MSRGREVPREEVPREIRREVRRERARTVMLSDVTRVAARSVLYAGSAFIIEYLNREREAHTRQRSSEERRQTEEPRQPHKNGNHAAHEERRQEGKIMERKGTGGGGV